MATESLSLRNLSIAATREGCPDLTDGYRYVNFGKCYQFVNTQRYWPEAQTHCGGQGGNLVTVDTADKQTWIVDKLNALGFGQSGYWIGAHDRHGEGHYMWDSGTEFSYSNWNSGQPDNSCPVFCASTDCVLMRADSGYRWYDYPCSSSLYHYSYICEFDHISVTTSSAIKSTNTPTSTTTPTIIPTTVQTTSPTTTPIATPTAILTTTSTTISTTSSSTPTQSTTPTTTLATTTTVIPTTTPTATAATTPTKTPAAVSTNTSIVITPAITSEIAKTTSQSRPTTTVKLCPPSRVNLELKPEEKFAKFQVDRADLYLGAGHHKVETKLTDGTRCLTSVYVTDHRVLEREVYLRASYRLECSKLTNLTAALIKSSLVNDYINTAIACMECELPRSPKYPDVACEMPDLLSVSWRTNVRIKGSSLMDESLTALASKLMRIQEDNL